MSCFIDHLLIGCAPIDGPSTMTQMKRWSTGLPEIFFTSKSSILVTITENSSSRNSWPTTCEFDLGL